MVSREQTAYHEAGHAVAGKVLGYPVEYATIVPPDDLEDVLGVVSFGTYLTPAFMASGHLSREVRGDLRERLAFGAFAPQHSESDREDAYECARHISRNPERYLTDRRRDARRLLHSHWTAVTAIATALLARGILSGDEVRQLLKEHGVNEEAS